MINKNDIKQIKNYFGIGKIKTNLGLLMLCIIITSIYLGKSLIDSFFESNKPTEVEISLSGNGSYADERDINKYMELLLKQYGSNFEGMYSYIDKEYISKNINSHTKAILYSFVDRERYHFEGQLEKKYELEYIEKNIKNHKSDTFSEVTSDFYFPLKVISEDNCIHEDFKELTLDCKRPIPILRTDFYSKYYSNNQSNIYLKTYINLWATSYSDGWDVGNGGVRGIFIKTSKNTPVYSFGKGKVIKILNDDIGHGKTISIKHNLNYGYIVSNYSHLNSIEVKEGDIVDNQTIIGRVGKTGTSLMYGLYFQIDYPNLFHPFYYSWDSCPYSFYEITEEGICIQELKENTIDPIAFIESNGEVFDITLYENNLNQINSLIKKNNLENDLLLEIIGEK